MTRQSTIERAARLRGKPGLACIGRFSVDGEAVDFPYSEDDLARDAAFWSEVLAGYGVTRGRRILVTAVAWELPWMHPVRLGATRLGASCSNTEAFGWDARRLDTFIRWTSPHAVLGPGREVLETLGNAGDLAERLQGIPALLVRPDGVETLQEAGINPAGVVAQLGPAAAVSLPDGNGLAVDESEWSVTEEDGDLLITAVGPRAARFDRQRTGVRGHVEQTPAGPRIVLED